MFNELQKRKVPVKMVMGPWNHAELGAGLPGAGIPYSMDELRLRFWDRYLRGERNGLEKAPDALFYSLLEDRWRGSSSFPVAGTDFREVFLDAPATLGQPGTLSLTPPTANGADALPWHPASGACSQSSENALAGAVVLGPCTENEVVNDQTGLIYDLPAADVDRRIAGPIAAHLFASTTRNEAFVDVRVSAVAPDGTVKALSDGNGTLSLRALDPQHTDADENGLIYRPYHPSTKESEQAVEPGVVYEWWIAVAPIAARIPAGYRLRVTVQPSDAFQAMLTVPRLANTAGGVYTIHHGTGQPASVVVPFQQD
jgi:putative CocE/NonD family hydrolase